MTDPGSRPDARRVVVAIDMSRASRQALEAAVEIAAVTGVAVHGVLVEDINLVRLAQLPDSAELGATSASRRTLDVAGLERSLAALASRVRAELRQTAARASVGWSFEVVRGAVLEEVLRVSEGAGLVALGRSGGGFKGARAGSTARGLVAAGGRSVWLQHPSGPDRGVVLMCRAAAGAGLLVAAAARLGRASREGVAVLVDAPTSQQATDVERAVLACLTAHGLRPVVSRLLVAPTSEQVVAAVKSLDPGVLVLAGDDPRLFQLLDEVRCSLLVTRDG